jgi:aminoglycoside 2''-phosphotransferase
MSTQMLYLSQIRTLLRNTQFSRVDHTAGQYHDVIFINEAWVFRFPRQREGVARLQVETRLLRALQGRLPLPIPDPHFERFDPPVPGLACTGYPRLPGDPLDSAAVDRLRDPWARDDLSAQLARFLRALHSIPLSELGEAFPEGITVQDGRAGWEAMYAEVREHLLPAMRPDARVAVREHFEAYLDDPALQRFDPCLRHGDFGGSNILWDATHTALTGVIDFSACAPGDPAFDLASVATLGQDLWERILPRYAPDPSLRSALQVRARFYQGVFALMEALDGLRLGDPAAYRAGMEMYL